MLIRLSKNLRLRLSKPVWLERDPYPQLKLKLKKSRFINIPKVPDGYRLRAYRQEDKMHLITLLNNAKLYFSKDRLNNVLSTCLPNACYLIEDMSTNNIVATMMARHYSSKKYLFSGRIDWLATDYHHRNKGLGTICASAATKHLIDCKYKNIYVTTDDHRIGALKVFYSIGFRPVISQDMERRWLKVYKTLGLSSNLKETSNRQ